MQYSLHKGSIVKLRAKLMLQALVPAHSCKPRPFFFLLLFFPSTPSPFFLLQVNIWCPHAIPGESPPLVLSSAPWLPFGVTHTRLSQPYSPALKRTQPSAPSHMQNRHANLSLLILLTFRFALTQRLLHMEVAAFSLSAFQ